MAVREAIVVAGRRSAGVRLFADLPDQGPSELVAEPADVLAQREVDLVAPVVDLAGGGRLGGRDRGHGTSGRETSGARPRRYTARPGRCD